MYALRKYLHILLLFFCAVEVTWFIYFMKPASSEREQVKEIYLSGETLDYSGQYRIIRFYRFNGVGADYNYNDVSLATQCSINHLHHLVELLRRWDGPVSCAVFAPHHDSSYVDDAITLLKQCFPKIGEHVTFHLVYPSSHLGNMKKVTSWLHLACRDVLHRLENYGYTNYDVAGIAFPHNVLRNAARTGVLTKYVMLVDIDVMPNVGLHHQFLEFAQSKSLFTDEVIDKTAYVLPAFEVKTRSGFPEHKRQLLNGVRKGLIRPFHNETCWWCHKPENFPLWSKSQVTETLEVAFVAEWDKSWEPFYIAHRRVPMFDERFMQYGFDRIQQICEMHVAGYKFSVLNNAFLTHHGWKVKDGFYAGKEVDTARNWLLFNYHFKDELSRKYNTSRTCSPLGIGANKPTRKTHPRGRGVVNNMFGGQLIEIKN